MRAALLCVVAACAVEPSHGARAVPLAGDSSLVPLIERVGAETGIAPEVLAATAWTTTRFRCDEDSLRAVAALIHDRGVPADARAALAHGISGRDETGARVVVAATGAAEYEAATWDPASPSNYTPAHRTAIDHIVIHDTEGTFDGTLAWFQDPSAQVSAHYVVRSSDGHVVQMVDEKDVAWHDKCFNDTTIGIEHEGYMAHADVWYTEAMYEASAALTSYLADKYGIAKQHGPILGHGEAPDCSDHTDPGPGWDWQHYIDLVQTGGVGTFLADNITVTAPASLESGEVGTVTVTITNGGTAGWDVDATRVGTHAPSELYAPGDWPAPDRAGTVEAQTAPGAVGTFSFAVRAPDVTEPSVVAETFQLVENDTTWFGPTFAVAMQVTPAPSATQTGGCAAAGSGGWACAMLALGALRRRRRR